MKRTLAAIAAGLLTMTAVNTLRAQDDLASVRERMAKRLPLITQLKKQKAVGENNEGYLTILRAADVTREQKKEVEEENADRKTAYAGIAEKTGATVEFVGRRRAADIAEKSAPGIMLQSKDGTWYEKEEP